jgi:hypothetical protein
MVGTDNPVGSKMTTPTTPTSETLTPPDDSSYDESGFDDTENSGDPESLRVANDESSLSPKQKSSPAAPRETALVARSKLLVYIFLVALAAVVGSIAYVFISREEEEDFEVKVR